MIKKKKKNSFNIKYLQSNIIYIINPDSLILYFIFKIKISLYFSPLSLPICVTKKLDVSIRLAA